MAPLLLPHKTETNVKVNGYMTPKNIRVIFNVCAIARDSDSWESPDKFKPERFLSSKIDYRGRYINFLPFSSGGRMCPGIRLAERFMSLVLVSLVIFPDLFGQTYFYFYLPVLVFMVIVSYTKFTIIYDII